jgi:hypothetical protein
MTTRGMARLLVGRQRGAGREAGRAGLQKRPPSRVRTYNFSVVCDTGFSMPDLRALEEAVKTLQPQDLAAFRDWFAEFDAAAWDRQIEADAASGKLDALLAEAEEDHKTGQRREL